MSDEATQAQPDPQSPPDPPRAGPHPGLRLWPGIVLMAVLWLVRAWAATGEPSHVKLFTGILIVPLAVLVGILLWWLLASRLRWSDRWLVVGTFAAATLAVVL